MILRLKRGNAGMEKTRDRQKCHGEKWETGKCGIDQAFPENVVRVQKCCNYSGNDEVH